MTLHKQLIHNTTLNGKSVGIIDFFSTSIPSRLSENPDNNSIQNRTTTYLATGGFSIARRRFLLSSCIAGWENMGFFLGGISTLRVRNILFRYPAMGAQLLLFIAAFGPRYGI